MAISSRAVALSLRTLSVLITVSSLVLYALILQMVTSNPFNSTSGGITSFPLIALGVLTLWNGIMVILTLKHVRIARSVVLIADLVAGLAMAIMGAVGFWWDDVHYLRNGAWAQYMDGNWFGMEIAGFVGVCCAVVLQMLIATVAFWGQGKAKRVDRGLVIGDVPAYVIDLPQQERETGGYEGSFVSSGGGSLLKEKGGGKGMEV